MKLFEEMTLCELDLYRCRKKYLIQLLDEKERLKIHDKQLSISKPQTIYEWGIFSQTYGNRKDIEANIIVLERNLELLNKNLKINKNYDII